MTATHPRFILTLDCDDRPGIVAAITGVLAELGCNIEESAQYGDPVSQQFFMRIAFGSLAGRAQTEVERGLRPVAERFRMRWRVTDQTTRPQVIVMVSRFDHCLRDLLYRSEIGALRIGGVTVVSNHTDARSVTETHGHAFHYIPITKQTKPEAEATLLNLVRETGADLVILARYMQVLSSTLSERLYGHVINIHHSFLPSFKGAGPYRQAHARGVKLIGATAHYVTPDLDEGPIIEQETDRVDHAMTAEDLVAAGRDIEARVLARAVKFHLEQRVLLNGHRTVVFR